MSSEQLLPSAVNPSFLKLVDKEELLLYSSQGEVPKVEEAEPKKKFAFKVEKAVPGSEDIYFYDCLTN